MPYEPLHHKYRPQTFKDLVGQETIALTLSNALKQEKIAPAYLFTGPRGTGKTSSARILAKSLNCLNSSQPTPKPCGQCEACLAIANGSALDVMEIDAASNTGVDNIREIIERSRFAPVQCRYKIYAIDECHMLSTAAFNALLKTLEEPPPKVVFILATTDPQRVLSTIISRCQRFDYRRIPLPEMISHLQYIAGEENITITAEAIALIAQIANGGLRDAESLLDQLSLLPEKISVAKVWDLVGAVPEQDLLKLLQAINSQNSVEILQQCRSLLDRGREPIVVLQNLASFYLNLLIAKTAPQRPDMVAVTETCWQNLCLEAKNWDTALILRGQQHLKEAESQLKHTTQPRLWLEVTLLSLLASAQINPVQQPIDIKSVSINSAAVAGGTSATVSSPPPVASKDSTVKSTTSDPAQPSEKAISPTSYAIPQTTAEKSAAVHNAVSSSKQFDSLTSPVETHLVQPVSPAPSVESKVSNSAIDNREIWNKVVSCLKPPMTKALLEQHCHLVSFERTSAIVGISSAKLQKLHQGKVSNIEAAFTQVCQCKVKVQLEVASNKNTESKNSANNIATSFKEEPPPINQPRSIQNHAEIPLEIKPEVSQPPSKAIVNEPDFPTHKSEAKTISNLATVTPAPVSKTQSAVEQPLQPLSVAQAETPAPSASLIEPDLDSDYTNNYLQQAIENLTQSFEGELVQMDNTQSEFSDTEDLSEALEVHREGDRPNPEEYKDDW